MEVKTKLEESYPKLIARRGFETLRRGPSPSELSVIPPPNSGYTEFEGGFKFTIHCLPLLLEKLVDLSRAVCGGNKFRKFPVLTRWFPVRSLHRLLHRTLENHYRDPGMCAP